MAKDYWPDMYEDEYALKRIYKSIDLADLRPGLSVLDVGCHKEELSHLMPIETVYKGLDYLNGYDIDGQIEVMGKWDRIFCLETLEHLKYPRKTLKDISEHLKEDGIAIISLPNEATLFHRLRSLFGIVDAECFSENGKHLHLPSLRQSLKFIDTELTVEKVEPYISDGKGCRQGWMRSILKHVPLELLSYFSPSLFSRGFIFVCKKR